MKTLNDITQIIAKQLGDIATELLNDPENEEFFGDYDVVVCSERIFVDDYLPAEAEYIQKNSEMPQLNYPDPNEQPYRNKIFVVINAGSGQRNYAVSNSDCTIDVLSEENDFAFARALLDEFIAEYNFKYEQGMVQAYFNPNVNSSLEEVYTGFRALLSVRGFVRLPETGFAFISAISIGFEDVQGVFKEILIPFTNLGYNWASQPDPQAFAGTYGQTKALNRQSTTVVNFSTYLNFDTSPEYTSYADFSEKILSVMNGNQNEKFHIKLLMPTPTFEDSEHTTAIIDKWFVLVNAGYNQELGDIDPWTFSFSEAKEIEE